MVFVLFALTTFIFVASGLNPVKSLCQQVTDEFSRAKDVGHRLVSLTGGEKYESKDEESDEMRESELDDSESVVGHQKQNVSLSLPLLRGKTGEQLPKTAGRPKRSKFNVSEELTREPNKDILAQLDFEIEEQEMDKRSRVELLSYLDAAIRNKQIELDLKLKHLAAEEGRNLKQENMRVTNEKVVTLSGNIDQLNERIRELDERIERINKLKGKNPTANGLSMGAGIVPGMVAGGMLGNWPGAMPAGAYGVIPGTAARGLDGATLGVPLGTGQGSIPAGLSPMQGPLIEPTGLLSKYNYSGLVRYPSWKEKYIKSPQEMQRFPTGRRLMLNKPARGSWAYPSSSFSRPVNLMYTDPVSVLGALSPDGASRQPWYPVWGQRVLGAPEWPLEQEAGYSPNAYRIAQDGRLIPAGSTTV